MFLLILTFLTDVRRFVGKFLLGWACKGTYESIYPNEYPFSISSPDASNNNRHYDKLFLTQFSPIVAHHCVCRVHILVSIYPHVLFINFLDTKFLLSVRVNLTK